MYFNGTKFCSLLLGCSLSLSLQARDFKKEIEEQGLKKPLCFIENNGQLTDQNSHPRKDIQYTLYAPGMSLFIGNGQMHYQFKQAEGAFNDLKVNSYRMDVTLVGANTHAQVKAEGVQEYYENYLLPQCGNGITAKAWSKITYTNVYPNIDWVLYVKDGQVEYDFDVHPGGKVSDIKLKYAGATSLALTKDGSIAATTPMGNVTERKPFAYDKAGKEVASAFRLQNDVVTFETGKYHGELTIDPYLLWSTYIGGTGTDQATAVAYDATHVYITGNTASTTIGTFGSFHFTNQGSIDAFVARYSSTTGALQYVTYYGGSNNDYGTAIAVNGTAVFIGGYTNSPTGIAQGAPPYHAALNGANDGFIASLALNGTARNWGTYYGGTGNDQVNGLTVDATSVYVTGQTASAAFVSSAGAYQTALSGSNDAFIAKFNAGTGAVAWSTYYGGTAQETGLGIAVDGTGNVYVTGQTNSVVNIASAGAYHTTLAGAHDAFVAKFTNGGTRIWGTYYGGANEEQANGIACDASGNIAIVGNTTSSSGIATANSYQTSYGGVQDAFVAYFNPTGTLSWGSYYGGSAIDYGQGVCFDAYGNVVVCGASFSTVGISAVNSLQPTNGGDHDVILGKFNSLGQMIWNTYFGGTFYDYAYGVASDNTGSSNQINIAGFSSSLGNYGTGGISTAGSAQAANGGGFYDGFLTRFKSDTFVQITQPYVDTLLCAGSSFTLPYSVYAPASLFAAGNVFTAQLSDATGSFAAPVNIGTAVTNSGGTITCTIPALTPLGTHYRVRVVASSPVFISPNDYYDIHITNSLTDASASSNSPVCVGSNIDLFDNPGYIVTSYSWSGPLGFSSGLQNPVVPTVTMANAGTYSVTTTHNGCPPVTATVSVAVNSVVPTAPTVGPNIHACAGGSLALTASPGAFSPVTYHWTGPAGFTSTVQNPTVTTNATPSNTGIYYVQDTFMGCASLLTGDTVDIVPVLPVSITITADGAYVPGNPGDTICGGTMVHFTAHPVNAGPSPTFQWMTSLTNPVVGATVANWSASTLSDGNVVYCKLYSDVECPSPAVALSNGILMNVITNSPIAYIAASPGIHVSPGSSITFNSYVYNGGIAPLYQWNLNGAPIPGATNDTYVLPNVRKADTITLTVTSTMMCAIPGMSTSNTLIANTNVGVANITASFGSVELFPNPNKGTFTVKGTIENASNETVAINVTNLLGQVVYQSATAVQNNELNATVELRDMPSGVYFLRLGHEGAEKVFRFAVQH